MRSAIRWFKCKLKPPNKFGDKFGSESQSGFKTACTFNDTFTLHWYGDGTGTGNGTSTIGDNGCGPISGPGAV